MMKHFLLKQLFLTGVFSLSFYSVFSQTDSIKTIVLNSVYISEEKPTFNTSSRQISALTSSGMKENGSQTLAQALSELPGVGQLTTGAISKPVIRGLNGNRIVVNMAGLRLEDQQWEDEYGLGFSSMGIQRVELIKGPASLLYGAGAMGGVINIVEDDFQEAGRKNHDLNMSLFSNTYGMGLDYGFKSAAKNTFLLRAGAESHADYSDGNGSRVPNSRFALYNLRTGYIIDRPHFRSENRLIASFSQFGFIADSADLMESEVEPRLSREFEEAHQQVLSTVLSSVNTFQASETAEWKIAAGFQNNLRKEQERSEDENLSLALSTVSLNASFRKTFGTHFSWTNGASGMVQTNSNSGTRIIVPDATISEGSFYSYLRFHHSAGNINFNSEAGARYDHRQIVTHETGTFNPPSSNLPPFSKGYDDLTGSIGESMTMGNFLLKADLSSGFRSGNLSELAANGLHEGTLFWYVGNPDMKPEQCLNLDVSASYQLDWLTFRGSVFNNWFRDFIYLQPTSDEIEGNHVWRYEQTNAILKGFEAGILAEKSGYYSFSADYSYLNARRSDHTWLPMIPANRFMAEGKYLLQKHPATWNNVFISLGTSYTCMQDNIDSSENPTPGYWLVNAGLGMTVRSVRILLTCRNLTGEMYYDHLSRLKYYGLYDQGRNIILNVGWQF